MVSETVARFAAWIFFLSGLCSLICELAWAFPGTEGAPADPGLPSRSLIPPLE